MPPMFPDAPVTARGGRNEAWAGSFVRARGVGVFVMRLVCRCQCCLCARHTRFEPRAEGREPGPGRPLDAGRQPGGTAFAGAYSPPKTRRKFPSVSF